MTKLKTVQAYLFIHPIMFGLFGVLGTLGVLTETALDADQKLLVAELGTVAADNEGEKNSG